jgi:hypothetical protein
MYEYTSFVWTFRSVSDIAVWQLNGAAALFDNADRNSELVGNSWSQICNATQANTLA